MTIKITEYLYDMITRLNIIEMERLQESFLAEPLYCTFCESLDFVGLQLAGVSSIEIWQTAKDCLQTLADSIRPDKIIPRMLNDVSHLFGSDDVSAMVMICVMYMICSSDKPDDLLMVAAKKIGVTVAGHPIFTFIHDRQRRAEEDEESSGNPVPVHGYLPVNEKGGHLTDSHESVMLDYFNIPDDLKSCVADKTKIKEYIRAINNDVLPYIKSPEGTAQMWEVVREVSIEKNFLSEKCDRKRFSALLSFICPDAGNEQQIYQNILKYLSRKESSDNHRAAIRSRISSDPRVI